MVSAVILFLRSDFVSEVSETNVMLSFHLPAIFTVKYNDSASFSFLFSFFFVKDQIASFQLKEIVVFLNEVFRVCIYFIALLRPSLNYNMFRVLHAVDSFKVKHELRSKRVKQYNSVSCSVSCRQTIFLGLPLENRV